MAGLGDSMAEAYTPKYLPGGGLDQNDPGNIAQYNRLMGGGGTGVGGGGAQTFTPDAPQPAAPAWSGGGAAGYLAGGGLDPNDPGNIARYYQLMGGGGGGGFVPAPQPAAPQPAAAAPQGEDLVAKYYRLMGGGGGAAPAAAAKPSTDQLLYKYFTSKGIPLPTAQGASGVVSPFSLSPAQQAALAGYNAETGGSIPGGVPTGGLAPSQQPWDASYYSAGGGGAGFTGGQGLFGAPSGSDFFGGGSNPFAAPQQPTRIGVGQVVPGAFDVYGPNQGFNTYGSNPWPNIGTGSSNVNDPWMVQSIPGYGTDSGWGAGAGQVPGFDPFGAPTYGGGGYGTWGGN